MSHRGQLHWVLAGSRWCGGGWCGGRGIMVVEYGDGVGGMVLGYTVGGDCVGLCGCEGDDVGGTLWGMMM